MPWLTASMLGLSSADQMWAHTPGIAAFAARAEPGLGTLGSLASLGGIWNGDAVPASRTTFFTLISAVVLLRGGGGVVALARSRSVRPLLVLALASVLIPAALATGPGLAVLHAVVEAMPGFGVLRDAQKWVALGDARLRAGRCGCGVDVAALVAARGGRVGVLCGAGAVTARLGLGRRGKVASVRYPATGRRSRRRSTASPRTVAVLPADTMRRFAWSGPAPVLDPLPRWLRADVLTTGDLTVSGATVLGEGDRAREVQQLLLAGADPDQIRAAGVGWVVVELGTPGDMSTAAATLARLPVAYRGHDLMLYRVGGNTAGASTSRRAVVVVAHLAWLAMLLGGAVGAVEARRRRRVLR